MASSKVETRGTLATARILEVSAKGIALNGDIDPVECMFNPYEYTVSKTNTFKEENIANGKDSPPAELSKPGAQTLKLNLVFDTYEAGEDVSVITNKLWKFMQVKDNPKPNKNNKGKVPLVAFQWGVFYFVSYITTMTQKFTLFDTKGTPVRAMVDVTFTQYVDVEDREPKQNPTTEADAISQVWPVVAGDRLDLIAAEVYHDATKWPLIAQYNDIVNPMDLRPGTMLAIPFD